MFNKEITKNTAKGLRDLAVEVDQVDHQHIDELILSISFKDITKGENGKVNELYEQLTKWTEDNKKDRYIYIIQASDGTDRIKCHKQYEEAKEKSKESKENYRAFARINNPSKNKKGGSIPDWKASPTLYVGSSNSISSRIKQHLGFGPNGTFALQTKYWLEGLSGGLNITVWRFSSSIDQDVIQALEDGLWEEHKSMFGRRGTR